MMRVRTKKAASSNGHPLGSRLSIDPVLGVRTIDRSIDRGWAALESIGRACKYHVKKNGSSCCGTTRDTVEAGVADETDPILRSIHSHS